MKKKKIYNYGNVYFFWNSLNRTARESKWKNFICKIIFWKLYINSYSNRNLFCSYNEVSSRYICKKTNDNKYDNPYFTIHYKILYEFSQRKFYRKFDINLNRNIVLYVKTSGHYFYY